MKLSNKLLVSSFVLVLSACGGGGSDSGSGDNGGGDNGISATVGGTAAKGIVINGLVNADELNSSGAVLNAAVGSAVTDSSGQYQLQLNESYQGGPIRITVTADANTTTVCDASTGCGSFTGGAASSLETDTNGNGTIDFGDHYAPATLNMSALIADAEDGETISVQVTPFTNMAAQRALSNATVDATAINQANSEVSDLLGGIDILSTEVVDITNASSVSAAGATAVAYAALSASISELAPDDANGQPDIDQALSDLSTEFSSGTFTADSMQDIIDEAANALGQTGAMDTSGVLASLQDDVDTAGSGGILDPEGSDGAGDDNVALAKAFIQDLRTWGVVIENELDAPSEAFEQQIELSEEVYDFVEGGNNQALEAAVMAIVDKFDDVITGTDLTDYQNQSGSFTSGTITETTVSNGTQFSIENAVIVTEDGSSTVNLVVLIPENGSTVSTIEAGIVSASAVDEIGELTVNSGMVTVELNQAFNIDFDSETETAPDIASMSFDLDVTYTRTATVSNGQVVDASDPIVFAGDLMFTAYPIVDPNADGEILDAVPGSFSLNGTVSNSANSLEFLLTGSIPDAASITPENMILPLDSSYAENNDFNENGAEDLNEHLVYWEYTLENTKLSYYGPYTTQTLTFNPANGSVDLYYQYEYGNGYYDEYSYTDPGPYNSLFELVNNQYIDDFTSYAWVESQGEYMRDWSLTPDYTQDGYVPFYLVEQDVEINLDDVAVNLGLQFSAQFDETPEAIISITGSQAAFETGTAMVSISYGDRSIVFDAETDPNDGASAQITISNSDGVELVISGEEGSETGTVTINNVVIASIYETENGLIRVDYEDGTFELF